MDAEELTHDLKPSLGDTLADLPGVSSTSFGPSASRPILRGEQGERAPILVDGISSLDLSATDPDHAVAINPLTAERIEILHGPGALLYTSSAVGGVVNETDTRIPRRVPKDAFDADALLNYATAAQERSGNLRVDVPLGSKFVLLERAPGIDELFSFGPHGGSAQFLIGDPDLKLERSNGAEVSVHRTTGPIHVQGSIYYSPYSNYIFEAPTGEIEHNNLAVFEYRHGKAKYYGFEVEADAKFGKWMGIEWGGELVSDAVRAKIDGYGNAPFIPPLRMLASLTGTRGQAMAALRWSMPGLNATRRPMRRRRRDIRWSMHRSTGIRLQQTRN